MMEMYRLNANLYISFFIFYVKIFWLRFIWSRKDDTIWKRTE